MLGREKLATTFEREELKYSYDALEPYIDTLTMETHYDKHFAAYTNNFNAAVEKGNLQGKSITHIFSNLDDVKDVTLRNTLVNNGGGFYNHQLYFATLTPQEGTHPSGRFLETINSTFGSFDEMKEKLTDAALGKFGSGWAWLSKKPTGELVISTTSNQSNPFFESKCLWTPIFGIDVWEHAYYLKHKNVRAGYLKDLWHVVDWEEVTKRYNE